MSMTNQHSHGGHFQSQPSGASTPMYPAEEEQLRQQVGHQSTGGVHGAESNKALVLLGVAKFAAKEEQHQRDLVGSDKVARCEDLNRKVAQANESRENAVARVSDAEKALLQIQTEVRRHLADLMVACDPHTEEVLKFLANLYARTRGAESPDLKKVYDEIKQVTESANGLLLSKTNELANPSKAETSVVTGPRFFPTETRQERWWRRAGVVFLTGICPLFLGAFIGTCLADYLKLIPTGPASLFQTACRVLGMVIGAVLIFIFGKAWEIMGERFGERSHPVGYAKATLGSALASLTMAGLGAAFELALSYTVVSEMRKHADDISRRLGHPLPPVPEYVYFLVAAAFNFIFFACKAQIKYSEVRHRNCHIREELDIAAASEKAGKEAAERDERLTAALNGFVAEGGAQVQEIAKLTGLGDRPQEHFLENLQLVGEKYPEIREALAMLGALEAARESCTYWRTEVVRLDGENQRLNETVIEPDPVLVRRWEAAHANAGIRADEARAACIFGA